LIPQHFDFKEKHPKTYFSRWSPNSQPRLPLLWLLIVTIGLTFSACGQSAVAETEVTEVPMEPASEASNAEVSEASVPSELKPEAEPSQAIEDMAIQVFAIEASLGENYYQHVKFDLDEDGAAETLVWLYGANFTTSKGDALMILKSDGTLLQAFHTVHAPMTLSDEKAGQYRSFYMYSENGKYARFDFGIQYPEVMEMACEVDYEAVEGTEIFQGLGGDAAHPVLF
jgi:hypothetical protein